MLLLDHSSRFHCTKALGLAGMQDIAGARRAPSTIQACNVEWNPPGSCNVLHPSLPMGFWVVTDASRI